MENTVKLKVLCKGGEGCRGHTHIIDGESDGHVVQSHVFHVPPGIVFLFPLFSLLPVFL